MDRSAVERMQKPQRGSQRVRRAGRRAVIARVLGIAVAFAAVSAVASLAVHGERAAEVRNDGCARKAANDSHFFFEAFFQNPPERNALAQIANACRK